MQARRKNKSLLNKNKKQKRAHLHELEKKEYNDEKKSFSNLGNDDDSDEVGEDLEEDGGGTFGAYLWKMTLFSLLVSMLLGASVLLDKYDKGELALPATAETWKESMVKFFEEGRKIFERTDAKMDSTDYTPELNAWIQAHVQDEERQEVEKETKVENRAQNAAKKQEETKAKDVENAEIDSKEKEKRKPVQEPIVEQKFIEPLGDRY